MTSARSLLVVVLLGVLGMPSARGTTHLVAIGNNSGRGDEVTLQYAERDAARFAEVMRQVGGVAASEVVLLQGADGPAVQAALATVETRLARSATRGQDVLLVYYSGHADAAGLHLGEDLLAYEALRTQVAASPAAVKVLILDGCRSGALTHVKGAHAAETFALNLDDQLAVQGLAVMTSSAAGEDSQESQALLGSFFSHHLLAALLGAGDADQDGRVTLNEAYAYAYRNTLTASGRTATLQHPTYAYDLKGRGDLVLTRLDGGRGLGRLRLGAAGTWLVHDGTESGPLRLEVATEAAAMAVTLPAGAYFVQARQRDHLRAYAVEVWAGQTTDLGTAPYERVAYAQLVRKGGAARAHGLQVMGGVEGSTLVGRGPTARAVVGYSLDLPWAMISMRTRYGQSTQAADGLESTVRTLGLGLAFERVVDLTPWLSASLGVLVEGLHLNQTFADSAATTQDRSAFGATFGALAAVEVPLFDGLAVRLEGGASTYLLKLAVIDNGAQVGAQSASRVAGFGGLGMSMRF